MAYYAGEDTALATVFIQRGDSTGGVAAGVYTFHNATTIADTTADFSYGGGSGMYTALLQSAEADTTTVLNLDANPTIYLMFWPLDPETGEHGENYRETALVGFNFNSVLAGATIDTATLYLYNSAMDTDSDTLRIVGITNPDFKGISSTSCFAYSEDTTPWGDYWGNQDPWDVGYVSDFLTGGLSNGVNSYDVTDAVQAICDAGADAEGTFAFLCGSDLGDYVIYSMRIYGHGGTAGYRPLLRVVINE